MSAYYVPVMKAVRGLGFGGIAMESNFLGWDLV